MTDGQRNTIADFCSHLYSPCGLLDRANSEYLWRIAVLYNKQTFRVDLDEIRQELRNGIITRFQLPTIYQLQLAHVPFVNVNYLVEHSITAIRYRIRRRPYPP